jgi:FMN phosphatase YigB (HAD superfamily)
VPRGIFKLLFERFEIPLAEAFYIDDNPRNVPASNTLLGMRAVQFVDPPTLRRDLVAHGLLDG